jgi:hypothetical protein
MQDDHHVISFVSFPENEVVLVKYELLKGLCDCDLLLGA